MYCNRQICLPLHHGMRSSDAEKCIKEFIKIYETV